MRRRITPDSGSETNRCRSAMWAFQFSFSSLISGGRETAGFYEERTKIIRSLWGKDENHLIHLHAIIYGGKQL